MILFIEWSCFFQKSQYFKDAPYDAFLTAITQNNRLAIYGWIVNQFEGREGRLG